MISRIVFSRSPLCLEQSSNLLFHRHSTRYYNTSRDKIKQLEEMTMTPQPHFEPKTIGDKLSWKLVSFLRKVTDSYFQNQFVHRACMLETIAAVPGIVCGVIHHFRSLRKLKECLWIKSVMDEAENERMHLMSFMELYHPTRFQRILIILTQMVFSVFYFTMYCVSPAMAHRFVGYLEEEACHTYSIFLKGIDDGNVKNVEAPEISKKYWGLPTDATLRDLVVVIRADEADHRLMNHQMAVLEERTHEKGKGETPCSHLYVDMSQELPLPEERSCAFGKLPEDVQMQFKH